MLESELMSTLFKIQPLPPLRSSAWWVARSASATGQDEGGLTDKVAMAT